jgi:hypothetical protein
MEARMDHTGSIQQVWIFLKENDQWQQQRVVVARIGAAQRHRDRELVAPLGMVPALDLALRGRNDEGLRACLLKRLPWPGHLDLLEAIATKIATFLPFSSCFMGSSLIMLQVLFS